MDRRGFLATAGALVTTAIAGCAGNGGDGGMENEGDGTESDVTVDMVNTSFDPVRASADVGATVAWVNQDGFGHDVTSEQFTDSAASWDFAETVSGGGSTTFTFDSEGVYEYWCTIHGQGTMCGAVLVGDVSLDANLSCE